MTFDLIEGKTIPVYMETAKMIFAEIAQKLSISDVFIMLKYYIFALLIYFAIRKEQPVNLVVLFDRNCKILFSLGVVGLVFFFMWCVFRTFVSCNWVNFVSF